MMGSALQTLDVASWVEHKNLIRYRDRARACKPCRVGLDRRLADLSFCCSLALSFEVVSRTAFWPQKIQFFKLKSDFDLLLEASWDPLGTILGDFWCNFGNFLATCLESRFGIDF